MAKSADAADLKSAGRKAVGVQVPLWAPIKSITYTIILLRAVPIRLVPLLVPLFSDLLPSACEVIPCRDEPLKKNAVSSTNPRLRHSWIRYKVAGVEHREKVGRRSDAIKLYNSQGRHSSWHEIPGERERQRHQALLQASPRKPSTGTSTTTVEMFEISRAG